MSTNIGDLPAMAKLYRDFMAQFEDMFVGREHQLELIRYALIQRQHVLLFGPPGTSKTALCDAVFSGIVGAKTFAIEFSKYMAEDALFGPYDVKKMREDGVLEHRIDDMLPQAKFARLGEFLDANEPLLRSTLGIMNERRLMRGTQKVNVPLMSVYCDTNIDPGEYLRKNPNSWAVFDRILFLGRLDYINDPKLLGEMVSRFQRGVIKKPLITIPVEVIEQLSSLIVTPPGLIIDRTISDSYASSVHEYRLERKKLPEQDKKCFILPEISDRRFVLGSQMLEAEAVLNGRVEVTSDDIMAAGVVLCTSNAEHIVWKKVAEKHIEEHKRTSKAQLKNSQGLALKSISEQLERDVINAPANGNGVDTGQTFQVLLQQFMSITPTDPEVVEVHRKLKTRFAEGLAIVQQRKLKSSGLDVKI